MLHTGFQRGVGLLFPQVELVGRGRYDGRRQKEGRVGAAKGAHELRLSPELERYCEQLRPLGRERPRLEAIHVSRQRTNAIATAFEQRMRDAAPLLAGRADDSDE